MHLQIDTDDHQWIVVSVVCNVLKPLETALQYKCHETTALNLIS